MNSSRELETLGVGGIINKTIQTEKRFATPESSWNYMNTFRLDYQGSPEPTKLKIKNHLCELEGNKLRRVTEISLRGRSYMIEDVYSIEETLANQQKVNKDGGSTNDSDKNDPKDRKPSDDKKIYIFKKQRRNRAQGQVECMRNTKNVSKNFCKAFLTYLRNGQGQLRGATEAITMYNRLFGRKIYNNHSIKRIIDSGPLRGLFRQFLRDEAPQWIRHSKINDKVLHYEAINIYLNLFDSERQQGQNSSSSSPPPSSQERGSKDKDSSNNKDRDSGRERQNGMKQQEERS